MTRMNWESWTKPMRWDICEAMLNEPKYVSTRAFIYYKTYMLHTNPIREISIRLPLSSSLSKFVIKPRKKSTQWFRLLRWDGQEIYSRWCRRGTRDATIYICYSLNESLVILWAVRSSLLCLMMQNIVWSAESWEIYVLPSVWSQSFLKYERHRLWMGLLSRYFMIHLLL